MCALFALESSRHARMLSVTEGGEFHCLMNTVWTLFENAAVLRFALVLKALMAERSDSCVNICHFIFFVGKSKRSH